MYIVYQIQIFNPFKFDTMLIKFRNNCIIPTPSQSPRDPPSSAKSLVIDREGKKYSVVRTVSSKDMEKKDEE